MAIKKPTCQAHASSFYVTDVVETIAPPSCWEFGCDRPATVYVDPTDPEFLCIDCEAVATDDDEMRCYDCEMDEQAAQEAEMRAHFASDGMRV